MSPFCLRIASTSQGYPSYPADNPTHPNTKMASDKTPGLSGMAIWEPMRFTQTEHYFIWWRMRKKRLFLGKIITSNRSTPPLAIAQPTKKPGPSRLAHPNYP